jgi:hypothetical protein
MNITTMTMMNTANADVMTTNTNIIMNITTMTMMNIAHADAMTMTTATIITTMPTKCSQA